MKILPSVFQPKVLMISIMVDKQSNNFSKNLPDRFRQVKCLPSNFGQTRLIFNLRPLLKTVNIIPNSPTLSAIEAGTTLENRAVASEFLPINSDTFSFITAVEILLEVTSRKIHALFELAVSQIYFVSKGAIRQCDRNRDNPMS